MAAAPDAPLTASVAQDVDVPFVTLTASEYAIAPVESVSEIETDVPAARLTVLRREHRDPSVPRSLPAYTGRCG